MGSFAMTCAVSDLPIEDGDKVRYLLLSSNPYVEENIKCYVTGLWFPRTYPIQAVYNDYGSIDKVVQPNLCQGFLDGLKIDMVEKGWGDNSVHDVPTKKDMTFSQMLEAVWEGRISVSGNIREPYISDILDKDCSPKAKEGVPNLANIEALICDNGYSIYDGGSYDNAFMVDEEDYANSGRVRVRTAGYSEKVRDLSKIASAAKKAGYAVMLTKGTGNYADAVDLLIRPLPGTKDYHHASRKDDRELQVGQCMIREDVWQVLVSYSKRYLKKFKEEAAKSWESSIPLPPAPDGLMDELEKSEPGIRAFLDKMRRDHSEYGQLFSKDAIPFTVGLGRAFSEVVKNHENITDEEKEYFIQAAAEMACIQMTLSNIRYMWRPSYSNGPQFGEWDLHAKILKDFHTLANDAYKAKGYDEDGEGI